MLAEDHSDAANFSQVDCTCVYLILATLCSHLSKQAGRGWFVEPWLLCHDINLCERNAGGGVGSSEIKLKREPWLAFWVGATIL